MLCFFNSRELFWQQKMRCFILYILNLDIRQINDHLRMLLIAELPFPRNADFVGRENELAFLERELKPASPVVIHGLSGMGKSQLALEFAYSSCKYSRTFWVQGGASLRANFAALSRQLGLQGSTNASEDDLVGVLKEYLRSRKNPTLLVMDDVEDPNEPALLCPGSQLDLRPASERHALAL